MVLNVCLVLDGSDEMHGNHRWVLLGGYSRTRIPAPLCALAALRKSMQVATRSRDSLVSSTGPSQRDPVAPGWTPNPCRCLTVSSSSLFSSNMLTPVVSIAHVMAFHDLEMLNFCFAWLLLAAKQKFSIPGSCGGSAAAGASAPVCPGCCRHW
ncbi:hypothetical protein JTE90_012381 [Oedothorax gibbosus]|uniref:Uncharacterized protein n=1 Tax=Oedothorax gibbosus TaxID=931172 RepID=A0AAV6TNJ3_9ARAC|nr:hypothetical protein JTE90_012381 [Oedothorax gibbosus]